MATAAKAKKAAKQATIPPKTRGGLNCTADRAELAQAIAWAKGGVAKRTTIPAMKLVRVTGDADAGTLTVRATDQEVSAAVVIKAGVRISGAVLLDPDRLATALDTTEPTAELDAGEQGTLLRCGGKFEYKAHDLAECPLGPTPPDACKVVTVPAGEFVGAVSATAWAVKEDTAASSRGLATSGLYLRVKGGTLRVYGADGKRAAICDVPATGEDIAALLPVAPVLLFCKAAAGEVTIGVGRSLVVFRSGEHELVCVQMVGKYPDSIIDDQLSQVPEASAVMQSADWFAAVNRAAAGCDTEWRRVTARALSDASVLVSAGGPHSDPAEVVVRAEHAGGGDGWDVCFDPAPMLRAERACGKDLTLRPNPMERPFHLVSGPVQMLFSQIDPNSKTDD